MAFMDWNLVICRFQIKGPHEIFLLDDFSELTSGLDLETGRFILQIDAPAEINAEAFLSLPVSNGKRIDALEVISVHLPYYVVINQFLNSIECIFDPPFIWILRISLEF